MDNSFASIILSRHHSGPMLCKVKKKYLCRRENITISHYFQENIIRSHNGSDKCVDQCFFFMNYISFMNCTFIHRSRNNSITLFRRWVKFFTFARKIIFVRFESYICPAIKLVRIVHQRGLSLDTHICRLG